jgi:hypothetical protein
MSTTTDQPPMAAAPRVPEDRAAWLARATVLTIAMFVAASVLAALVLDTFGVRLRGLAFAVGPVLAAAAVVLLRRRVRGAATGAATGTQDVVDGPAKRSPLAVPLVLVAAALLVGAVLVGVRGAGPVSEPVTVLALDPAGAQGDAVVVIQDGASQATFDVVFLGASGELGRRTVTVGGDDAVSVPLIVSTTAVQLVAADSGVPLRSLRLTADG